MADQYAGNPANYPNDFTLPDDSAPPKAVEVNVALEALGDRTAWLRAHLTSATSLAITSSQSVVVPNGAVLALVEGWGGGGGAGAGKARSGVSNANTGGGGGAGAIRSLALAVVVPGETLDIVIGAGGNGGTTAGASGTEGASTTVTRHSDATVLAKFFGGGRGNGAIEAISFVDFNGASDTPNYSFAGGGRPCSVGGLFEPTLSGSSIYPFTFRESTPQAGGPGISSNVHSFLGFQVAFGNPSPNGNFGGPAGIPGTTTGISFKGGGCGGGGGAGPGGPGGAGGNGTAVNESGPSGTGGDGGNAADNSGGGGGGGGSAGGASSAGGLHGKGGKGGSGFCRITWIGRGL